MAELPDVVSAQGLTGCLDDDGACGDEIVGRGRCRKHYARWWRRTRGQERPPALNLRSKTPAERYWEKVNRKGPDDCWPWGGSQHRSGHGEFFVSPERGTVPAHTFSVELATGEPCPAEKEGCHHCDNPPCVNPAHVYYGTRQQNVDDMWSRGRTPAGSARAQAKLTESQILEIRRRFADGEPHPQLVADYGVSSSLISRIVTGQAWKHVGGPIQTPGRPGRRHIKETAA